MGNWDLIRENEVQLGETLHLNRDKGYLSRERLDLIKENENLTRESRALTRENEDQTRIWLDLFAG